MLPKNIKSIWIGTTPSADYPKLEPGLLVDVVVVGGGIAGLNAAYFLMQENLKVAVIEMYDIAMATSGNTTAKVTSQHDIKYEFLIKNYGFEKAKLYAESNEWAIRELENITKKENINCNLQRLPSYVYATTKEGRTELENELAACRQIGLPASIEDRVDGIPFAITGALKFENQACFHPRKYLLALAEKIVKKNNHIFENTQVLDIKEADVSTVITDQGEIRAKKVIIATNYPIYDKGFFAFRMSQIRSYALAAKLKTPVADINYINFDTDRLSHRPYQDKEEKWAIIGAEDHVVGEEENINHFKRLEELARKKFDIEKIDYVWAAQDSTSIDRVPFIGRMPNTDNVYVITGFGEWGMTTSLVSAKLITDLVMGRKNNWSQLYDPTKVKPMASFKQFREMLTRGLKNYLQYFKKDKTVFADLEKGTGRTMTLKGQKAAVYKDENGRVHSYSAVCTHLGCIVNWNPNEKSWDCPCHGSRFTKEGGIINGPAVKPLPKIDDKD
ncbi:MAG: putative oxidoreductase [Parcubacteria group bacterium GW2011_GWE2_39_37]|uniref:Putative oxidoreductase n=1 Tax=Candidatus Falkowbacteria bacterium GW2011_GWF2_39_8 TaxID=1618642 RepID=A0A0G0SCQ0_9BACT|nr:MAG: putative oxidoreductase [Parcubacteria group bacterium GW2011_GWE2_39_37]KKR32520.1 MAG: putative oxidoreductase [Candidatus Falkowbacteria bacterium GW2011_GWF2_39_8]